MSAAHSPIASAADRGWETVDAALEELDRVAAGTAGPDEFHAVLARQLAGLGFRAVALWTRLADEDLRLAFQSPAAIAGLEGPEVRAALANWLEADGPRAVDLGEKLGPALVAPWKIGGVPDGLLVAWRADATGETAGFARLLGAVAELVAVFRARQQQAERRTLLEQQQRLGPFTEGLHETLDLDSVAYRIANDGRAVLGCDRMAVAVRRGHRYRVLAVSGAEHVHRRSESIRQLEKLCDRVVASGEPLWHGGRQRDLLPQVSEALDDYLDLSPAIALAIVPLFRRDEKDPAPPDGVLVCEQYVEPFSPATRGQVELIAGHCRLALANARAVGAVPARGLWLALGREGTLSKWGVRGLALVAVLALASGVFTLVPAELQVKARGELQPAIRHEIFAPREGVVTAVLVDHGAQVAAGAKLLEIRSPELDLQWQQASGELETKRKELAAAQSERLQLKPSEADFRTRQRRLTAEVEQLQEEVKGYERRLALVETEREELTVRSPVAGEVITWDARQRLLTRPLRRGDALLTLADPTGPWQLELQVPSRLAGRLLATHRTGKSEMPVSFQLVSDPGHTWQGTVQSVAERVETDEAGQSHLLVTVQLPAKVSVMKVPGSTAVARISCGQVSLGEAWFYELWDAVRLWLPW
ncbi:MAG: HlyD family efflux transporter periplasmic adaptor subunit [Pirellulaceae bacterium]|nr:HlyD family efflux transporter periplasmic adaptor subunit [Pirellulaceae bacterium]